MNTKMSDHIINRVVPDVAGLDLEQALNYTCGLPLPWFYTSFTYPRIFYRRGSRPKLEAFLLEHGIDGKKGREHVEQLVKAVHRTVVHYSITGKCGPSNQGGSEEAILQQKTGWCNEQARVLASLAQIAGFPSRLIFAGMPDKKGHVLTEIFVSDKWALVDQSAGHLFPDSAGNLLNVLDLSKKDHEALEAGKRYREALQRERARAADPEFWDRYVSYGAVEDSLLLFHSVGFHNYFIH